MTGLILNYLILITRVILIVKSKHWVCNDDGKVAGICIQGLQGLTHA